MAALDSGSSAPLEERPGVFLIGAPNVGKRTLLSRLLSIDFEETSDLSEGVLCHGWTIQTKYYSADISIWTTHLGEGFSFGDMPIAKQLDALVMVFDMSNESSFTALQDWVASIDIQKFEILLCIGNKADLVPGHYAHAEYRRLLQRCGESSSDPHPEFLDCGIYESEGCSLLGEEEPSFDLKKTCLEWCCQYNIEFIEACASNIDFDKCLSTDGDIQGVQRLHGALSAHMWPGMVLKSGGRIATPSLVEKQETTDDESDYEIEYDVLSHGSDEPWEGAGYLSFAWNKENPVTTMEDEISTEPLMSRSSQLDDEHDGCGGGDDGANADTSTSKAGAGVSNILPDDVSSARDVETKPWSGETLNIIEEDQNQQGGTSEDQKLASKVQPRNEHEDSITNFAESDEDTHLPLDDLERLMGEVSNMRNNLRLMPDFQRREMAAKLAMKMAAMFGETSDEEDV